MHTRAHTGSNRLARFSILLCLMLFSPLALTQPVVIDATISGSWFAPNHEGQGWVVEILDEERALIYWFTYDDEGSQVWIAGLGTIDGDTITVANAIITSGGVFDSEFDPSNVLLENWGTMSFTFTGCNRGTMIYDSVIPEFGSGNRDFIRFTSLAGLACQAAPSFAGQYEGTTSQELSILLTVNDTNTISDVEFVYQQPGEIPPDPNCRHTISLELSSPISTDGTFSVDLTVPATTVSSDNTRVIQFEGTLSGSFSDSQGTGQLDLTRATLFCQRTPNSTSTVGCGGDGFLFGNSCDGSGFDYDVSRTQ